MTESEYINATNLAKLRAALDILCNVQADGEYVEKNVIEHIRVAVSGPIKKLEDVVICDEEG